MGQLAKQIDVSEADVSLLESGQRQALLIQLAFLMPEESTVLRAYLSHCQAAYQQIQDPHKWLAQAHAILRQWGAGSPEQLSLLASEPQFQYLFEV